MSQEIKLRRSNIAGKTPDRHNINIGEFGLNTADGIFYFKQLIEGVSYMHKIGIAHMDLKLENIMVDSDNKQIKIIDLSRNFGHHYAMQAGLKYAIGDYIFLIELTDIWIAILVK